MQLTSFPWNKTEFCLPIQMHEFWIRSTSNNSYKIHSCFSIPTNSLCDTVKKLCKKRSHANKPLHGRPLKCSSKKKMQVNKNLTAKDTSKWQTTHKNTLAMSETALQPNKVSNSFKHLSLAHSLSISVCVFIVFFCSQYFFLLRRK